MTDQERRRAVRHQCTNRWIEVAPQIDTTTEQLKFKVNVRVDNISLTGVCLISTQPFELDQTLLFFEEDMPRQGTVVWTSQSKIECRAGVQFS